jgi:hypothetical protein
MKSCCKLLMSVAVILALSSPDTLSQRSPVVPKYNSVSDIVFAFRSGADSPTMQSALEVFLGTATPSDRATACYYLGRYFHRKYEWSLVQIPSDTNALKLAYKYYQRYTSDGHYRANSAWMSDCQFYKAMYYVHADQISAALNAIKALNPNSDQSIYLDCTFWTRSKQYRVSAEIGASELKRYVQGLLSSRQTAAPEQKQYVQTGPKKSLPDLEAELLAAEVARWAKVRGKQ